MSYRKHVTRNHAMLLKDDATAAPNEPDGAGSNLHLPLAEVEDNEESCSDQHMQDDGDLVKPLSLLFLKWKEGRRLPESTLNEIANDIICYLERFAEHCKPPTSDLNMLLQQRSQTLVDLDQLQTRSGRNRHWKECFPFVEPETVVLGTDKNGKVDTFQYVSVCEMLKCTLENPSVWSDFYNQPVEDGYLTTVFDGTAYRDHTFFQGDRKKICIQLYSDEFEVCNPLGSKRGKHKLTAVYYSILNFPQKVRSRLSGIHLALLVKDKFVASYGLHKIFAPLVRDISRLEKKGISVNGEVLYGSVLAMTGDNLSSHRLGGFKCSFSHGRICRFCMALRHEISYKHLEQDFTQRSPAGHKHHIKMLMSGAPTSSLYGVRAPCVLTFSGFEPTEHLPPDLMHDMLEGVIPFVMRHVISHLISHKFFTLSALNLCILNLDYPPYDARNKPEEISSDYLKGKSNIRGSASQILCFFRNFSLYVGLCVPSGNEVWGAYLLLRKIVDILMSRKVPLRHVPYLQRLIHFFCLDFQALFPHTPVPCKLHYLIHYPSYIYRYGPLVSLWAMRFESKHQYFKDVARKVRNFKNIAYTLAARHQYLETYLATQVSSENTIVTTGCKPILYEHLPEMVRLHISEHDLARDTAFVLTSVAIDGFVYTKGSALVQSVSEDEHPEFVQVCELFSVNRSILVLALLLKTIEFDEHLHLYVVHVTADSVVLGDLHNFQTEPLFVKEKMNKHVINLRHGLF